MSFTEGTIEIVEIMLTPDHNWGATEIEKQRMSKVDSVECVAGKGLRGDRYFDHKEDFHGQVTFIDQKTVDAVKEHAGKPDLDPSVLRRNILLAGIDLNELIGKRFSIDGTEFSGSEECSPCRWMDVVAGEGAKLVMKDRGGLRCRILSDGTLKRGEATIVLFS
ncbi:MAG: MOSC domain-containing protein [Verrucomicrobiota bacterium]